MVIFRNTSAYSALSSSYILKTFLDFAHSLWQWVHFKLKFKMVYGWIEFWTKAVKLECKRTNFPVFSDSCRSSSYDEYNGEGVVWNNQLAKYMTIKSHSSNKRANCWLSPIWEPTSERKHRKKWIKAIVSHIFEV